MPQLRFKTTLSSLLHWAIVPVIATAMTLWPTLSSGLEKLQTDPGDTLLNLYFLEHAYKHFIDFQVLKPAEFWSPDFFWPVQDTLAWSDHLLGPSVIYGAFRSLCDPFQSYVGWIATTLWLNYTSIRVACKRIAPKTNPYWISIASLTTSFSPAIIQQLGHPQLLSFFLIGPILWQCHRLIKEPPINFTISNWLQLGFWLLANGFFNIYIFVYASYGVLFSTFVHFARRAHQGLFKFNIGQRLAPHIALLIACLGLNAIIYFPYLQTLETFGRRDFAEIIQNLPKIGSWFFGNDQWLLPPPLTHANTNGDWVYGAEQELFPGWSLLILLAGALITAIINRNKKQASLNFWLLTLAAMLVTSLSFNDFSLWIIISKILPGSSSLRASSRVAIVIVLYAAPSIALAAKYWQHALSKRCLEFAAPIALIGSFIGIWPKELPSFSLQSWRQENNVITSALRASNCDLFWHEWSDQPPWRAQVMAMHAQLRSGIPTLNGYSGHFPKTDWPFTEPSGIGAYSWVALSKPEQNHRIKLSNRKGNRRCIVNYDSTLQQARIREITDQNGIPSELGASGEPNKILFSSIRVQAGSDNNQRLYIRSKPVDGTWSTWTLLTRDGKPIPADRGDYKITAVTFEGNNILVTDSNFTVGIEYIWSVDAQSGLFKSQIMRTISKE